MCGVAGVFNTGSARRAVDPATLTRMCDAMAHRGPDGAGLWISDDGRVGLGHRRLAIIDRSEAASQPMRDGDLVLSFNGEIYNHSDLRSELSGLGIRDWRTDHSDTEVILKAYRAWGIECIHRFRGMFAFALWDGSRRELWLVRDRVGIKPLYFTETDGRLLFASEIKALLQDGSVPRAVDEEALFHYLSFLTTPAPRTLFAGIEKLPAGCRMRVSNDGSRRIERYWDALESRRDLSHVPQSAIPEMVLGGLREAVRLRKISDVPVGVFLSGGVDSSTNAALFSEGEQGPMHSFSIGYDAEYGSYPSELGFARQMAEQVGSQHHERILSVQDLLEFMPKMVAMQDEPIADPVCVPVYYVSELARRHGVTVCQVGEGADELFLGYPQWLSRYRMQRWAQSTGLAELGRRMMAHAGRDRGRPYEWLRRAAVGQPLFWGGAEAFTDTGKRALLSRRLREKFVGLTSWEALAPIRERFLAHAPRDAHLDWMTYLDLNLRLPELLLMRVDKMSMATSLEARVPFLDHEFVSLVMSLPAEERMQGGVPKGLLKSAVRGLVPDNLIDRRKQGFGVPIAEWFLGALGDEVQRVTESFCLETDLLDVEEVRRLHAQGAGVSLWPLYNLAMWWRTYVAGGAQ